MKKIVVLLSVLMMFVVVGSVFAEDAAYTCDQNIEDFWDREYENLTITLDERCTRQGAYYTEYEFRNIKAENIEYSDKQTSAKYGAYLRLVDSEVEYLKYSNYTQRGGVSLRGTTEIGIVEIIPSNQIVSIAGNGSDYENRVLLNTPENHNIDKIIWHATVQGNEMPAKGDGRVLNVSGITANVLEIISDYGNYEARVLHLNDYSYIDKMYTSTPVELDRNLPSSATDNKRFETTIGTLVISADKLFNIFYDGVVANNIILLGNNTNTSGGVAFNDKNFGLLGNVLSLGGNMSLTNYGKFPGKSSIQTLYVDNNSLNLEEIKSILDNSQNIIEDIITANSINVSYESSVKYYFTFNYANIENVKYSSYLPEPVLTKNNESALIGTIETF